MWLGDAVDTAKQVWQTFRQYSEMHDSPWDRWKEYVIRTVTSESLSNVFLGGVASALATVLTGQAGVEFFIVAAGLWVVVFALYGLGNELLYAYRAAEQEFSDDPRGIY